MTVVQYAILTHNRSRSLAQLMQSIAAQAECGSSSVTIFDNGSGPAHAQAVAALANAYGATVVRSAINLQMAGRRALEDHILDQRTAGDVLVHLDDDVVLHEGWLRAALCTLADEGTAACGSVEDRDGDLMISGQRTIAHARVSQVDVWQWTWHEPDARHSHIPVDFAGHRALAVLTSVAASVRHDPVLIAGGDDIDYSLAIRQHGGSLAVAREAVITHRSLGEPAASPRTQRDILTSWRHFYAKWGFVRDTAAGEAGMALESFVAAVAAANEAGLNPRAGEHR